jgi:Zn finger protein HypA/HybF involved in hydrogenase expression
MGLKTYPPMPHWSYDEGYCYCSNCGEAIPPFLAYFNNMRCPYCGKKIRGDQRAVERTVLRKISSILSAGEDGVK